MKRSGWVLSLVFLLCGYPAVGAEDPLIKLFDSKDLPRDARLGTPKDLNGYFPFTPPLNKEAWEKRRQEVREQLLVAEGLWPMPEKSVLRPVIHGKIDRDEYTIEKVFFASYPGHYVCGNLYRPKHKNEKVPGVLCPHGHWRYGRFTDEWVDRGKQGDMYIQDQIDQGAEKTKEGARFPLQARCAMLARMGCVVFHYDMVGYADSKQIPHRQGFTDAKAELYLQSVMGLQTFNSIRALDFLLTLPEVDSKRIGVTGASGGGTQTFILCAIDDRPAVAFPAVMVSTAMQGGCLCENCSYLRLATGNVELAGLFAPKPLGMSAAKDWTIDIETKGLPELKTLYRLYNAEDHVMAKCFPQFGHNYNQVSRELMYNWFNKHLNLGYPGPVNEKPFVPVAPKELSVFDETHPVPKDAVGVEDLRKRMTEDAVKQLVSLKPNDASSLKEFRRVIGTALRIMIHDGLPEPDDVEARIDGQGARQTILFQKIQLGRKGQNEQVPVMRITPPKSDRILIWIHPAGKSSLVKNGELDPLVEELLTKTTAILAPDVFGTGEFKNATLPKVNEQFAGFTFGYNRSLLANRAHDILTVVAEARRDKNVKHIDLVGFEQAGPWVLLARALCGASVHRAAVDMHQFRFDNVLTTSDKMMLPGALKYGGLPAFAALCAPGELFVHNHRGMGIGGYVRDAYKAAGQESHFHHQGDKASPEKVLQWLLR